MNRFPNKPGNYEFVLTETSNYNISYIKYLQICFCSIEKSYINYFKDNESYFILKYADLDFSSCFVIKNPDL